MARGTLTAPKSSAQVVADLRAKGAQRTPQETAQLIEALCARIDELEQRLNP